MPKIIEGNLIGDKLKIAVIMSRFNNFISERLLEGCIDGLVRHGIDEKDITVFKVPGSFEIPGTAMRLINSKKSYDAVVCLGSVIRGETPHFEYVAAEVSKGIANVGIKSGKPVVFGIVTSDTVEQAIDRAGTKAGNKGFDAAVTAIELANLYKQL